MGFFEKLRTCTSTYYDDLFLFFFALLFPLFPLFLLFLLFLFLRRFNQCSRPF